jgi:hypothetical protein
VKFQSLPDAGLKFPAMLSEAAMNQFGMLVLSGKEILVPLDDPNKIVALSMAVTGHDHIGRKLKNFEGSKDLAAETVTVMLVKNDREKHLRNQCKWPRVDYSNILST